MKNYNLKRISELTEENIESAYTVFFNRWKFENSDEVRIDDELLSKDEKASFMMGWYKNKTKAGKIINSDIIVSDLKDNIPLTEDLFINSEIKYYESLIPQIKGIDNDIVIYSKSVKYLDFLNNRLKKINRKGTELKDKKKELKDLFIDTKEFDRIIEILIVNNIAEKLPQGYKIVSPSIELKEGRFISCIGYLLKTKGYLKKCFDKDVFDALNYTFNTHISKAVFSDSQKYFEEGSSKGDDYLTAFHFIKKYTPQL